MNQENFLTLAAGFLMGVLATAVAGGAFFQVRLVTERERADKAEQDVEQERDRADEMENQSRMLRLDAERAEQMPPPRTFTEEDKKRDVEEQKRRRQAFWEAVEQERKKKQAAMREKEGAKP